MASGGPVTPNPLNDSLSAYSLSGLCPAQFHQTAPVIIHIVRKSLRQIPTR